MRANWQAIAPGRMLDVPYDALVSDLEKKARHEITYLGLNYHALQTRVDASALPVSAASCAHVREPIHDHNLGGQRRDATQLGPLRRWLNAR